MPALTSVLLCCTLFSVCFLFISADQKNIKAVPGQTVTLPCQAPKHRHIIVVKWSRRDLDTEYVLLYRDEQFDPENQHPSFKNRVDLQDKQMKDGDVSLILKDVTTADSGTYECRVVQTETNHGKRVYLKTDPIIINLSVVLPDQKVNNITAESGQKNVTLTCRAPNNNTIIIVEWSRADLGDKYVLLYRNERFDPDNQHPSFKNRVDLKDRQMKDGDVSLILKNVTINDAGTYECRVKNELDSMRLISIIHLHVVPPDQKIITSESGQDVTLSCRAANNNKPIIVGKWSRRDLNGHYVLMYRDQQFVPDEQRPSFKNRVDLQDRQMKDGDVSLILKNVTTADNGTYECHVVQGVKQPLKLISIIYLRVVDPPDQKIIPAKSGQKNVTLPCRAPNNNVVIIVEWSRADLGEEYVLLFRDKRLNPDEQHPSFKNRVDLQDRQMKDGDVSLILKDVTVNDTGTYECRVVQREAKRRKRAVLDNEPISIITLRVVPPGQTGGDTEDGGKEAGGKESGSVGLIVGLSVSAVLLVAAVVGFLMYRKHKQQQSQDSYQPPVESQPV
ncbi:uncharacterized protein LOC120746965 [Simochromis diagramma]|uniref:uncharacterized protein LOC120746965 n=1 Tax=Simochromis diagramma TaxID=43689 RepID=UPI001A7E604E|nr:uncharacterized protein LOC120746965 [Simochromis diagramma]